jgi:hypothetical protein
MTALRSPIVLPLLFLVPLLLAGDCGPVDDDDDATEQQTDWETMIDGLEGALIAIWGTSSTDVWTVGGHRDEVAPLSIALHYDGTSWTDLEAPTELTLWWVCSNGGDEVWMVGDEGIVLRHLRSTGQWTEIDTPVDTGVTLFGCWVPEDGSPVYTVGGHITEGPAGERGPVLLSVENEVATQVQAAALDIPEMESFFKFWGSAEDDLWMISDGGSVFHFDGAEWSRVVLPDSPRLVTINGGQDDDVVIVGGVTQAVIFERDGAAWADVGPVGGAALNGVYVSESGEAWAAGSSNAIARRAEGGWIWELPPLILWDWHAVWLDETDTPWLVGGNLIDLSDGAVVRYDPLQGG